MDDQLKLAYLAGLFDGEGTVTLTRNKLNSQFRFPVLSMSSTSLNLLEICKTTFGGHISTHKVYKEHHKQSWTWKVTSNAAIEAASKLVPYIQEPSKKQRLTLILTEYKECTIRNGKYSEAQKLLKLQFESNFFHPSETIAISP